MIAPDAPVAPDRLPTAPELVPEPSDYAADVALVPAAHCIDIALPRMPVDRRDLKRMIAAHLPVRPELVAWTDPIAEPGGGARLVLAKRAWLDQFVGELEKARGRSLEAHTERDGLRFNYVSPASRRARSITIGTWLAAVIAAGIVFLVMSGGDGAAGPEGPAYEASVADDPTFTSIGMLATVAQLPIGQLPDGLLAGISAGRDGSVQLDLNTQDPDILRELLAEEQMLSGFREIAQRPSPNGAYVATYELKGPRADNGFNPSRRVPVLRADDAAGAIATVKRSLASYAAAQGVQLSVFDPAPGMEGAVEVEVELTGPQSNVLAAATAMESGAPPMRFAEWRVTPGERSDGRAGIRLTGTLIVPWMRSP